MCVCVKGIPLRRKVEGMESEEEIDQDLDDQIMAEAEEAEEEEKKPKGPQRRFSEKRLRRKLTSMLGRTAYLAEEGLDDGTMSAKEAAKIIKDLADTCNKVNGSPTAKIQMGEGVTATEAKPRALSGKQEPQMNLEAELENIRNAGNSPV